MMVLDDEIGQYFTDHPSKAFWRAYIVEDHVTHRVAVNFRFRYSTRDTWYHLEPKDQSRGRDGTRDLLIHDMRFMLTEALLRMFAFEGGGDRVLCFYPPKPEDAEHTMQWLLDQDLIAVVRVEGADGSRAAHA
jgi:hypothetical protein